VPDSHPTTEGGRTVHVYCGNYLFGGPVNDSGEPPECSYEADVPLTEYPEEDETATFICPGCGATNLVVDHS
jgi:hypothetical protein